MLLMCVVCVCCLQATAKHLGLLGARLAKARRELLEPKGGGGGSMEGFDVKVKHQQRKEKEKKKSFFLSFLTLSSAHW